MEHDANNNNVYNPLDRRTFESIAFNAIGRGSEVNTLPAYKLTHSVGLSGWSVGLMQWDFGQSGRRHKVADLLSGYQAWAQEDDRFNEAEIQSLTIRIQTPGQAGNSLTGSEQARLNSYLRSDPGRAFVDTLDREQVEYKWLHVGQPLSEIVWLQNLSRTDPAQTAELVAMASKRFNQGEARGREFIRHLEDNEMTSAQLADWIVTTSSRPPANREALLSGRDNALAGTRLMNALELGEGRLSRAWNRHIHADGNTGLTREFNADPEVQLFDAMMRNPTAGLSILEQIQDGAPARAVVISGTDQHARREMSRIEVDRNGVLTIHSPTGDRFEMTPEGWNRNGMPLLRELGSRREPDFLDLLESAPFGDRFEFRAPDQDPDGRTRPTHGDRRRGGIAPEHSGAALDQQPFSPNHPDYALFEAIRRQLPPGTGIDMAAYVMVEAKGGGIAHPDKLDEVIVRNGKAYIAGKTIGDMAIVDLSASPPTLKDSLDQSATLDRQRSVQLAQFMDQQRVVNERSGPSIAL